jgi:hypothetical protein
MAPFPLLAVLSALPGLSPLPFPNTVWQVEQPALCEHTFTLLASASTYSTPLVVVPDTSASDWMFALPLSDPTAWAHACNASYALVFAPNGTFISQSSLIWNPADQTCAGGGGGGGSNDAMGTGMDATWVFFVLGNVTVSSYNQQLPPLLLQLIHTPPLSSSNIEPLLRSYVEEINGMNGTLWTEYLVFSAFPTFGCCEGYTLLPSPMADVSCPSPVLPVGPFVFQRNYTALVMNNQTLDGLAMIVDNQTLDGMAMLALPSIPCVRTNDLFLFLDIQADIGKQEATSFAAITIPPTVNSNPINSIQGSRSGDIVAAVISPVAAAFVCCIVFDILFGQ